MKFRQIETGQLNPPPPFFRVFSRSWRQLTNLAKIPEGTRSTKDLPQISADDVGLVRLQLYSAPTIQIRRAGHQGVGLVGCVFCLLSLGIHVSMRHHTPPLEVLKHIEASNSRHQTSDVLQRSAPNSQCLTKEGFNPSLSTKFQ